MFSQLSKFLNFQMDLPMIQIDFLDGSQVITLWFLNFGRAQVLWKKKSKICKIYRILVLILCEILLRKLNIYNLGINITRDFAKKKKKTQ